MILILMYHRIDDPDSPDRFNRFCAHIEWLCQQGEIILPGENPNPGQMGFCLTFDDAYVDYPHKVFPFLRDKGIPSVLGIPTGLIEERTSAPYRERLIQSVQPLEQECRVPTPLSTWEELRTLAKDPLIRLAAHGYGLLFPGLNGLVLARVAPEWRSRASGWVVTAFDGGFFGLLLLLGPLAEYGGYGIAFAVLATLQIGSGFIFLRMTRSIRD